MTPQEKEMIDGLIQRVNATPLSEKDADAEALLQQGLGRNPDALYVLAQTVLVQKYALEQAQAQLSQMRQQAAEPKHATSFLGSLLHLGDSPAPAPIQQQRTYAPPPPPPPPQQQYAAPPPPPPGYGAGGYGAVAPQGGGFLRGAMQTAAGVAAGALAFEGVESLMHGFGHAAGYGSESLGGFGGGMGGERPEVINNYYGDSDRGGSEHGVSAAEREEGSREDRLDDSRDDTSRDDDSRNDTQDSGDDLADNDSPDDSSFDDGGGDDSGGGDDGSFA